ncbi:MAG: DUF2628 domain-containing protein [Dysgonomonas sp.]|nr:DUF2628 domain-containing protein [Dysgonomonas sp.]
MEEVKIKEVDSDIQYYEAYFGKEKEYYLNILERLRSGESLIKNWYAFFFGFAWLAYRKMYLEVFIGFIAMFLIDSVLIPLSNSESSYNRFMNLLYALFMAFFGNKIYIWKTEKMIRKAKEKFENIDDQLIYLEGRGGTSVIAVIVLISIFVVAITYTIMQESY